MDNVLRDLKAIVALCKRRGFIYPGSDIYGGFANTYSFGPYGAELKKNIKDLWWKTFVHKRTDIMGIDGPILLHPNVWKASGHVSNFNDALVDCKNCKARFRVDHLLEETINIKAEGLSLTDLTALIQENNVKCPSCGKKDFTEARNFNLMFQTNMSKIAQKEEAAFLRPETAQSIFIEFKNIINSTRAKIPFGLAQIGKAFRNEITPGNFIFRVIEFEQMEIEYFIEESAWQETFASWLKEMHHFCELLGLKTQNIQEKEHDQKQLSHYSKKTVDITYNFPFGFSELYGLAYRADFDLKSHETLSNTSMEYTDKDGKKFIPHVIEPTFGVERTILAVLCDAYEEEKLENGEIRSILHLSAKIAPVKAAVFPLMGKEELVKKAKEVFNILQLLWKCEYDESGAIGRRYRRQDELGTPYCITIDFQTLQDDTVTLRERDSMKQTRIAVKQLHHVLSNLLS